MEIALRNAAEEDRKFLLHLRKLTMIEHLAAAGIHLTDDEHEFRIDDAFDCSCIVLLSGEPVGHVKFRESDEHLEIMQLQILPECQGAGIGRTLVQSFIEKATTGNKVLKLSVLKRNPAKRLYERLGFNVVGEDEHEFYLQRGPGEHG